MTEINRILGELKDTKGVLGCGIVSKDGRPVDMRLPAGMNNETIAIMCATVYGGSTTLHTEAGRSPPKAIKIKTDGYRTAIYPCGRRSLAIVMLDDDADMDAVHDIIQNLNSKFGSS